ncbi:MAG: hypothetical protein ACMUIA_00025 [bacterium]
MKRVTSKCGQAITMRTWPVLLFLISLSFPLGCTTPGPYTALPHLVGNPGFEIVSPSGQPANWSPLTAPQWALDSDIAYSGLYSLRVQNQEPSWYRYVTQEIFVVPGKRYRLGVWIRGENLVHSDPENNGATFCVEYFDKNWSWLGGYYEGSKCLGTFDWHHLVLEEIIMPPTWMGRQVTHISLCLLLTKGTTGTAWFDDFTIKELKPPLLETFLLRPNYRGLMIHEESPQVRVQAGLHPEVIGLDIKDLTIHLLIRNSEGEVVKEAVFSQLNSHEPELVLDVLPDQLLTGDYSLVTQLRGQEQAELRIETIDQLRQMAPGEQDSLPAFIDRANRLLCRGVSFFPLGIYTANTELSRDPNNDLLMEEIEKIADANSPFDTLVNYNTLVPLNWESPWVTREDCFNFIREYLDLLNEHSLRLLCPIPSREFFSLDDTEAEARIGEIVGTLKDHPAILGWYLNDEIGLAHFQQLSRYYRVVRAEDPNHPTWSVLYQLQDLERMATTTDILGVDPYPVPHTPIVYVAEAAEAAVEAGRRSRPFWIVIQTHGSSPPTREQIRGMTYLGLIHRASGLFYYSYFDLITLEDADERWEWIKSAGREVKALQPILLSSDEPPPGAVTCSQSAVHCLVKRHQTDYYLLLINSSETDVVQATFQGSDQLRFTDPLVDFLQQKNLLEGIADNPPSVTDNAFKISLDPLEIKVYSWPVPISD